jgi:hypothetical protein
LTRAAIYDYRLEPGDIDIIIALTHAAICHYRLEPGDIDIIIALTHAAIFDYRLGDIRYYYRLVTRRNL